MKRLFTDINAYTSMFEGTKRLYILPSKYIFDISNIGMCMNILEVYSGKVLPVFDYIDRVKDYR